MGSHIADPVSGVIETGAKAIETVAGVFTENAERGAERAAEEQQALLRAYQAEFNQRSNRSWVDAIADAFNRLVRPTIVTIIISIFIIAYISPEHFATISLAMSSIPGGYWALLSVIVGFYFGGRMQLKSQDFQLRQSQVAAVQTLLAAKKEFRRIATDGDEPDRSVGDAAGKDPRLEQLRKQRRNGVVATYLDARAKGDAPQRLAKTVSTLKALNEGEHPGEFVLDAMSDS